MAEKNVLVPKFDPRRFDEAWRRYIEAVEAVYAPFSSHLNEGASMDEVAAAEKAVECSFAPDLRHLLAKHNGGDDYFVLPGWELFSAERIVEEWRIWENLYRDQFKPEGYDCEPNGPVRADEWWRLKWIPFCGDGGGNHLCIDMEPDDGGALGQIITMWHDDPTRTQVAESLTHFVETIAEDFEHGALTWSEEWGGVYAGEDES